MTVISDAILQNLTLKHKNELWCLWRWISPKYC